MRCHWSSTYVYNIFPFHLGNVKCHIEIRSQNPFQARFLLASPVAVDSVTSCHPISIAYYISLNEKLK